MKTHKILLQTILMIIISFSLSVFAQIEKDEVDEKIKQQILSKTDTVALKNFGTEYQRLYNANKYEAIEYLLNKGYLIKGPGIELQGFRDGRPWYYTTYNRIAAQTVRTDAVWDPLGFNLHGSGIEIGLWDGGAADEFHNSFKEGSFGPRHVFFIDSTGSEVNDHATHVAGTIVADNDVYNSKGMADKSVLYSRDWNSDVVEMTNAAAGLDPNFTHPLILSNHSYGSTPGWVWGDLRNVGSNAWYWMAFDWQNEDPNFGNYNETTFNYDAIAFNAPYYTIVWAAGNDRGEGPEPNTQHWVWNGEAWVTSTSYHPKDGGDDGYDCVPPEGVAKNMITVGAVDDIPYGYENPSDVKQVNTNFSVWGPTKDGRIKPDIVANGDELYSTLPNNTFGNNSGTSMSSPNVTGSLALLLQHYKNTHNNTIPLSSTLKAIVIHTADEAGENPGPDYKYGWGLLNTYKAAQLISQDQSNPNTIRELLLQNGQSYTLNDLYSDGTQPIKITLAWNDIPPSNYQTGPIWVRDLDVRLYKNGTPYYPWILYPGDPGAAASTGDNTKDNVEQIFLQSPGEGFYSVVVSHKGTISSSQMFSLIVTGFTAPFVTFNLKQIGSDNQVFGQAAYWDNLTWYYVPPTQPVTLSIEQHHFLSTQEFRPNTYEKFNHWEDNLETTKDWYRNWDTIGLRAGTNLVASRFVPKYSGVTIKNSLEGTSVTGGTLFFYDPWLTDVDEQPYGLRNQGISAPPKQRNSPFYPDYTTSYNGDVYKGVFLNQNPQFQSDLPIYNVWAGDQLINLGSPIGIRDFKFMNWTATGANLQAFTPNQQRVVFTSGDAEVRANYKGLGLSNQTDAYSNNSQRKFVRTEDGFLHSVYESLNEGWYELSTDNGNSWNLIGALGPCKNPSIDFFDNFVVIAYYYSNSGFDGIIITSFKKDGSSYVSANTLYIEDIYCSTAPYPVVAVGWGSMTTDIPVMITWKQNPGNWNLPAGLYCRYARISYFNRYLYWVDGNTFQHIPNTTAYSSNPTLYGYLPSFTFYLAWQENDTQIKYSKAQAVGTAFQFSNYEIISTNNGFSKNYNPTITAFDDYEFDNVRIAWIAYRKTYSEELPPEGEPEEGEGIGDPVSLGETKVFFRSKINGIWSGFNSYGSSINSVNINRNINNTFAFAWSEGSSNVNKFVRSDTPIQVYTTNTAGKHLQVGNYSNLNNMRLNAFTTSTTPFSFSLSNTFNNTTPEESIASAERQGIIVRDSTAFYFSIGDILINDELIYFEELPDSLRIDNRETLNSYLVSEPFNLTDYTTFYYGVQYGVTDSALAAEALSIGGYVNYKVELVDDQTGEILGTFDDVTFNYENIIRYENLAYQVNTQGIGNRICRLRLVVDDDLDFNYSIVTGYNNELSLAKRGFVQRTLNSKEVVETYDLSQNYPNPFNPSTVIKYQIPADGVVTLKIYDILGKEVTILVNEQKIAGKYELNFDAGNLASGVYIYRIQVNSASGGFVSSKKMMLLK